MPASSPKPFATKSSEPVPVRRHSSRTTRLDTEFLANTLRGASKYLRIAGYFRSSIFELVGEEISQIEEVKIVCNSELDLQDFLVATGRETSLKERWNQVDVSAEAVLHQDRYARLDSLLKSGKVEIRVVPRERLFLHGKAGSVHYPDGRRVAFVGSVNETRRAFAHNYELVWEDDDPDAAQWVEEEFWELWKDGIPLPETILKEIERVANRREVTVEVLKPEEVPAAALAETPIYRGGEQLQPWQRSFVTLFLAHRETYGKTRLLLADEVGVGKTLSMAVSALVSTLLGDGPSLILAPSTLTIQWQLELMDKLGIPSAVWSSQAKVWLGPEGQQLSSKGDPEAIKHCPYQIAIVSTGLITHQRKGQIFVKEAGTLLQRKFGCVILDEAHKARLSGGLGKEAKQPNNLLAFMLEIGRKTRHLILGTATPIQTNVGELWELMKILSSGVDFVLGDSYSPWRDMEQSIPLITGLAQPQGAEEAWKWLRNPLPPGSDDMLFQTIRDQLGIQPDNYGSGHAFSDLDYLLQEVHLPEALADGFFQRHNPLLRHVVLRKRSELEDAGLLEKVGVRTHPLRDQLALYENRFVSLGISTNSPFEVAYEKAEEFCRLLQGRTNQGGFMKTLMLQRICSSFASGLSTATKMLKRTLPEDTSDQERLGEEENHILSDMGAGEIACLKEIATQLSRPEAVDSKLATLKWFLTEFRTDGKTWLEHGCIVFSQYFDTTEWVARELSLTLGGEVVGVYAGTGKSGLFKDGQFSTVHREVIKAAVKRRELRLVVATDAACEGLNLQTLGTLINVDLPWNPSRLEQRLGRIKRFGQARKFVDMLNLVYAGTQDETVYNVLSDRLKGTYDIFGSLPEAIEDDWIDDEENLRKHMDVYVHERESAQNAFSVKYRASVDPDSNKWEYCAEVLSRKDITTRLSNPWR
jgi:superfamily II DNA or RNA helicase